MVAEEAMAGIADPMQLRNRRRSCRSSEPLGLPTKRNRAQRSWAWMVGRETRSTRCRSLLHKSPRLSPWRFWWRRGWARNYRQILSHAYWRPKSLWAFPFSFSSSNYLSHCRPSYFPTWTWVAACSDARTGAACNGTVPVRAYLAAGTMKSPSPELSLDG